MCGRVACAREGKSVPERERGAERQTDRQRERERDRETQSSCDAALRLICVWLDRCAGVLVC